MPTNPDSPAGPDNPAGPADGLSPEEAAARSVWRAVTRARREAAEEEWIDKVAADPDLQRQLLVALSATHAAVGRIADGIGPGLWAAAEQAGEVAARWSSMVEPLLTNLQTRLAPILGPLFDALGEALDALLPPNLDPIRDQVNTADVYHFVRDRGIPLWLVPRADLALALLNAPSPDGPWQVLDVRADEFLDDCDQVLDSCTDRTWTDLAGYTRQAVAAARAGHHEAGQALAASVLDTLWNRWIPSAQERGDWQRHDASGEPPPQITDAEAVAMLYALLPAWRAYKSYWTSRGDPIPGVFARHATAHGVSPTQYTKANCVQGCMVVVSMLGFLQGEQPRPIPPPVVKAKRPGRRPAKPSGSSLTP